MVMSAEHLLNSEKAKIKKELQEAIHTLIAGCEALDMELAFGIFSNSPDFLMMATDGSLCDYQTYLNNNVDYLWKVVYYHESSLPPTRVSKGP